VSNAVFLVDGHLEQKFLQRICPNRPVRRINCNGRNVSVMAIGDRIATQCRLLNNRYYPVIIVIDREDRTLTANEFATELLNQIRIFGINDDIILGIADRMIENWILADHNTLNQYPGKKQNIPTSCEGDHGKNIIKSCLSHYHETTVGVDLLETCKPSTMIANSSSFKAFYEQLPKNCIFWLSR
jgi:hypothetical protein